MSIRERQNQLRAIADAMGVPVSAFFGDAELPEPVASAREYLRLWFSIRTAEGRREALDYLRSIVEAEAARGFHPEE